MTEGQFHPKTPGKLALLFICMGNICRSPTAEAVFAAKAAQAGLLDQLRIDSAGTHNYHPGEPPDVRSQAHAKLRGYSLGHLRARQLVAQDFERFDLMLVMDWDNLALTEEARDEAKLDKPALKAPPIRRITDFCMKMPASTVPDPYYGGDRGFELVLDILEDASEGLVEHVRMLLAAPAEASSSRVGQVTELQVGRAPTSVRL